MYLMSGGFDLTVIIKGRTMREVARFVSEQLAPMENVLSTGTHFILKKYKDNSVEFDPADSDKRERSWHGELRADFSARVKEVQPSGIRRFLNWRLKCRTRSRSVWASRILKRRGRSRRAGIQL